MADILSIFMFGTILPPSSEYEYRKRGGGVGEIWGREGVSQGESKKNKIKGEEIKKESEKKELMMEKRGEMKI